MNENKGIFRIVKNDDNKAEKILGTAFAIRTLYGASNKYYLLTAYHVISELKAKKHPIIVKGEDDYSYDAKLVFPKVLSKEYRAFDQDYALLEIYSDINYKTYEIAVISKRTNCFVRGAASHYSTIYGKILGEERILKPVLSQQKVLQISLNTKLVFDNENKFISEQDVLRGLSGAPVLVEMQEEEVCVGVLGNLERDLSGSIKYAVPIKTIVEECLKELHIEYRLFDGDEINDTVLYNDAFIEAIFGDTEEFLFSEEKLEQEAWNKLSNMFYRGTPVDFLLNKIIKEDNFQTYSAEIRCAIEYFYARLSFKRNNNRTAFKAFQDVSGLLCDASKETQRKLSALMGSRRAIESGIVSPDETLKTIRYAGDSLIKLSCISDTYLAYELASMYGRGLTNLFSFNIDFTRQAKEDILKIYHEHKRLLDRNPQKLRKQDVVNTSLQWYIGFWGINNDFDMHSLSIAVNNGFRQSRIRKNSIFYIQSLIAYAVLSILNNENVNAIKALLLSVRLAHKEKIQLDHEGIRQLLLFLKVKSPVFYAIFILSYMMQTEQEFCNKASLYSVDLGCQTWEAVLNQVNTIYTNWFKGKTIYNVNIDVIKTLF